MASKQLLDEITNGDCHSLQAIARRQKTALSTPPRWHLNGVKLGEQRVYLEAARLGGRLVTSLAAVRRFLEAINPSETISTSEISTGEDLDLTESREKEAARLREMVSV